MSENEQQGSELPTPYKLERARKQGSVPRTADLTGITVLGIALLVIFSTGYSVIKALAAIAVHAFSDGAAGDMTASVAATRIAADIQHMLGVLAPMLFAMMIVAICLTIVQVGPVFAIEALKPQWSKLNPVTGLKRLFSKKGLIDTCKSSIKLIVLGAAIYLLVVREIPRAIMASPDGASGLAHMASGELSGYVFRIFVLLVIFALIDLALSRREFTSKMMMTRREMKDEHKNREGDPRIKSRIRELRQEMLKRAQSLRKVPQADVLLTNPTRIAIALRYSKDEDPAPRVIAKGAGDMAARMRAVARKHGIPVIHQPSLARELFRSSRLEDFIPPGLFPQIAKIMAWAFVLKRSTVAGKAG